MIDKRKQSVITTRNNANNNNNIFNKRPQQKNINSILKNTFNAKMNNSISFANNFRLKKGSVLNYKIKNNIQSNETKNIDTTMDEFNNTCIDLL